MIGIEIVKVVIVRHGEKTKNTDGVEVLTLKGMKQIQATCKMLKDFIIRPPEALFFSGAERTLQCATVAQMTLGLSCAVNVHPGLHFDKVYQETLGGNYDTFLMEFNAITAAGNTIAAGLERSEYVRRAREQMIQAVLEIAKSGNSLCFSHSPISSFAAPDTGMHYDIGLADAVIYKVSSHHGITRAYHLECPLK